MKKIIVYMSFLALGFILSFNIINVSNIKTATGVNLQNINHTEFINVTGEFINADNEEIVFSYPIYIKEVFVTSNSYVQKNQALFSIDKEKMLEMANSYGAMSQSSEGYEEINEVSDVVYSNSDGIITSFSLSEGDLVLANTKVLDISNSNDLLVKFTVSQSDFGKIAVGDKVSITSLAFSDIDYQGEINDDTAIVYEEVSAIGSKVLIDVFADVYNLDSKAAQGLQVTAEIQTDIKNNVNILNYEYINQDEGGEFVYILTNGIATKEYITVGIETQTGVEILNNFKSDTIFLKGEISQGDKVVLIN